MDRKNTRVTIYDIASELNISPSTVTRSLNNQSCISKETRALVQETANRLGYRKNMLAHGLKAKPAKIGIILRNRFPEFQKLIVAGAMHACSTLADFNASIEISLLDVQDYDNKLLEKFAELADKGCDGIVFAPCSFSRAEEMDKLIEKYGIKASSIFHDTGFTNAAFFVSANNTCSGRIAADLFAMSGLGRGDQLIYFTGLLNMVHHKENLNGFMEMNERYGFNVQTIEHQDNEMIAYYATEQILAEQPGVKGIFCATAVTTPVCRKVVEAGRANDIVIVGTELLTDCIPYIEDNTLNAVIFQNPYKMGYLSYKNMFDCINSDLTEKKSFYINPQIVIRGNIAYYEKRITDVDSDI